jgi:diketogulonate reductase-like aldo/keto reductase
MAEVPEKVLNNDAVMPGIGFGTWNLTGREVGKSVSEAFRAGYRLIDTAKIYGNEEEVGKAIKSSRIRREEIFITTKLWPGDFDMAREAFETSLDKLGLDYIDLYLIHWPRDDVEKRHRVWEILNEIYDEGLAKAIGVSNFKAEQLKQLLRDSELVPAVNQIEFHPFIYQDQIEALRFCQQERIAVEAYSPLAQGYSMDAPEITRVSEKLGKTNAQVMIRWAIQHDTIPIPRSHNPEHIKSNFEVSDYEIPDEDMKVLDSVG